MESKKPSAGVVSSYRIADTNLKSTSKRKSNDSNSYNSSGNNSDQEDEHQKRPESASTRPGVDSEDQNKKLKTTHGNNGIKPVSKIQLKLSSSLSSGLKAAAAAVPAVLKSNLSTKNDANKQTESVDLLKSAIHTTVPKLPSGNLAPASTNKQPVLLKNVSEKVAKVFGSDDDDDNETEMPMEAKMKMRNLGRNTPTSQGPNSYGKTSLGFCDSRKLFEKQLKEKADQLLREETEKAAKK